MPRARKGTYGCNALSAGVLTALGHDTVLQ